MFWPHKQQKLNHTQITSDRYFSLHFGHLPDYTDSTLYTNNSNENTTAPVAVKSTNSKHNQSDILHTI
jgi:hypothetical protein